MSRLVLLPPTFNKRTSRSKRTSCFVISCALLGFWFLIFGAWLLPATAYAQNQAPDLTTYAAWVREASTAAQRGDRLGLEAVAKQLAAANVVRLADGSRLGVDNRWLSDALRAADPDFDAIAARLGAITDALAQPPSAAPADARAQLATLLNNPPFKQPDQTQPQTPSWLTALIDWLGRLIDSLLRPVTSAAPAASGALNVIGWIIIGIGVALIIGVLAYVLRGLRRTIAVEAELKNDDPEAHLTAKTALDQAGELARGGDYRTAVRYLYLSALLRLDERGLLRYDRALTNREYLERARDNPVLSGRLQPIVETFDRVWYGHATLDDHAFAVYREQVEALRDEKVTR